MTGVRRRGGVLYTLSQANMCRLIVRVLNSSRKLCIVHCQSPPCTSKQHTPSTPPVWSRVACHAEAAGAAACAPCAAGSFKGAAGDGLCAACPLDHFCPEGTAAPKACAAHSSAETGRAAAEECLCMTGFRAWSKPVEDGRGWDSEHACRACVDGEEC